jgi:hypothetical protein
MGTSSWEPHNLMHNNTLWALSPGVVRQGFTAAIMAWVESPLDSSHLFLVPRIQQRSFGLVNKHVEFIGQFKEAPWGRAHSPLVPFVFYYLPPCIHFFNLTVTMEWTNGPILQNVSATVGNGPSQACAWVVRGASLLVINRTFAFSGRLATS